MYFSWNKYPFKTPPELSGRASTGQVAVIGAGPVGLAAALALAQQGVRVVVLEARDQVSDGSRAISLDTLSMRMLDRLGVGAEFSRLCIGREENVVFYRDSLVYQTKYEKPAGQKHSQFNILQQCWMEQLLLDGLKDHPNVDLRWLSRVTGLTQTADAVELQVETPEGAYTLQVDYAVASDGGRGVTRRLLGIEYESVTEEKISERPFVICDFELDTAMSKARRFYLDPPYKPGSTVLLHAQPFNTWRLDYSIEDDEDAEDEAKPDRVAARLDAHLAMIGETGARRILWTSVYRPRAVTTPRYRAGRIFLAGDAAHLSPIFGGRGLNLGFGDAWNLSWKLAAVLAGRAPDTLLDSYEQERRQMVRKTLSDLSQAAVFMARPSKGVTLMCNAVLDMVPHEPFVRDLFDAHRAPKREGYSQTANWNDDPPRGANPGNPLPNAMVQGPDGQEAYLGDLLPAGFAILACSANGQLPPAAQEQLRHLQARLPVRELVTAPTARMQEELQATEGTVLLVRPDGYVAGRAGSFDIAALDETLSTFLSVPSTQQQEEPQHA
jgi:3-(3-hydroxy-phenyl)propionate hydroxylase